MYADIEEQNVKAVGKSRLAKKLSINSRLTGGSVSVHALRQAATGKRLVWAMLSLLCKSLLYS